VKTTNYCRWRLRFETDFSILTSHRSAKSPTPHHLCTRNFTIGEVCRLNCQGHSTKKLIKGDSKGAFTLANFTRDFALSLHVLQNKNYLFSLLNVQASAKLHAKSRQCKRTLSIYVITLSVLKVHLHRGFGLAISLSDVILK
jgi:hypothetical protein